MQSKKDQTIEKILTEALELRDKGVSLHAISGAYPEQAEEIRELFASIGAVEKGREAVRPSMDGLRKILTQLPELDTETARSWQQAAQGSRIESPYMRFWSTIHLSAWKLVLPVAAIALFVAGGFMVRKNTGTPDLPAVPSSDNGPAADQRIAMKSPAGGITTAGQSEQKAAPMAMRFSAPPSGSTSANTALSSLAAAYDAEAAQEQQYVKNSNSDRSLAMADDTYTNDPTTRYGF